MLISFHKKKLFDNNNNMLKNLQKMLISAGPEMELRSSNFWQGTINTDFCALTL